MLAVKTYWQEHVDVNLDMAAVERYSQFKTYYSNDLVLYKDTVYICVVENGYKFSEIRIPMVESWLEAAYTLWQPIEYRPWDVVVFEGTFYTLLTRTGFDNNATPLDSDCWGAITNYDPAYNEYEFSEHEYVAYEGRGFYPGTDVNADRPQRGVNLTPHDPRNYNLKKHMVRLALYELTKLIAPNNVRRGSDAGLRRFDEVTCGCGEVAVESADPPKSGGGQQACDGLATCYVPDGLRPV